MLVLSIFLYFFSPDDELTNGATQSLSLDQS